MCPTALHDCDVWDYEWFCSPTPVVYTLVGWGLFHYEVWRGFVVTILWFLSFLLFAGVAMRIRK